MTRNVIQNAGNSYNGVRATTPAQFLQIPRDPGVQDVKGFIRGTFWLNTVSRDLWRLAGFNSVSGVLQADWVMVGGAVGDVTTLHTDDGHDVTSTLGVINVVGTHGLNTTGTIGPNTATWAIDNTITLGDLAVVTTGNDALTVTSGNITLSGTGASAAGNINLPATTTDGRQGIVNSAGTRFISNYLNTTAVGNGSGNLTATGLFGSAFGIDVLTSLTTGSADSGFGAGALQNVTTGDNNSCFGFISGQLITTGSNNSAIGAGTINNLTTGSRNMAMGHFALTSMLTGSDNVAIGDSAGGAYVGAESSNILIGSLVSGTVGESNVLRIGNGTGGGATNLNKAFISGIRGITTDVNDAIAVLVDSAGQLGTVSSSIKYKQNIRDMNGDSEVIYDLHPVVFNYRKYPDQDSWGLIAEEVEKVFPQLVVYKDNEPETVKYHDLVPLLLNEIIKLRKRIIQLENK